MIILANDLKQEFKKQWPSLRQIWLRNNKYIVPTLEQVKKVTEKYICELSIIKGYNECENFALYLHANVKKHNVMQGIDKYNWAFGDFICQFTSTMFGDVIHTANICYTKEGFYFIEPMERNKIVKSDKINNDYKPFFINLM